MKNKFSDFYDAYMFLYNHPMVNHDRVNYFSTCLDIEVVKVDPNINVLEI